jgi:hypothetical protein
MPIPDEAGVEAGEGVVEAADGSNEGAVSATTVVGRGNRNLNTKQYYPIREVFVNAFLPFLTLIFNGLFSWSDYVFAAYYVILFFFPRNNKWCYSIPKCIHDYACFDLRSELCPRYKNVRSLSI